MPLETIEFKGKLYPAFQSSGFAARFAFPFAMEVCKGTGYDIGCNRLEWALPSGEGREVFCIDPALGEWNLSSPDKCQVIVPENEEIITETADANNLPKGVNRAGGVDFIFSSHCLEHLPNWSETLTYWHSKLKPGGILFLYLPDHSQVYWRPWHNKKHVHSFTPDVIRPYFNDQPEMWKLAVVSGVDANCSFMVIAEKR